MKKKILSGIIIIIAVLSSIIIPNTYADNNGIISIPITSVKVGDQAKVYINLENITGYTLTKIVLSTNIYLEPVLDTTNNTATPPATTSTILPTTTFNPEFVITDIPAGTKTLCVSYPIPQYLANGTVIQLLADVFGYSDTDTTQTEVKQYENTYAITVIGVNSNTTNNTNNTQNSGNNTNGASNNNTNGGGTQAKPGNSSIQSNSSKSNSTKSQSSSLSSSGVGSISTPTITYNGSRNNYLSNLKVTGYSLTPKFNKTNNTYFITVSNKITSVAVTATKEDSSAVVTISGNTGLNVGLNKVLVSVLAQNGDVRYYRIYVTREG